MLKHLLFTTSLLFSLGLVAQEEYPWEIGLHVGLSTIGGDMIEQNGLFLDQASLGGGIHLRRRFGGILALRAHLMFGTLSSDDTKNDDPAFQGRGFSSKASILEPGLALELEPLANKRFAADGTFKKILSPYFFGGLGWGIWSDPEADFNGRTGAEVAQDRADGGSGSKLVLPVGAGLRWYLSPKTSLALEHGRRITGSDYLDGVSAAANPDEDDVYAFTTLGLNVGFGKKDSDGDGIADDKDMCPTEAGPASTGGCPDTDGDGIADKNDRCPTVAGPANLAGCPDTDGDGIADKDDSCPEVAGLASLQGCPDTDGDGIADKDDKCPEEAGLSKFGGCPDTDGDGIMDSEDKCPTEAGPASNKGCPVIDTDGDGIPDDQDNCPTEAGTAAMKGCPDTDGDGIADKDDKCPTQAGPKSNQGCPEITQEDKETIDFAIQNINFETAKAIITADSREVLARVIDVLNRYPAYQLAIGGHTDSVGSAESNQKLSERRAEAVFNYLRDAGIPGNRMTYAGFGETMPIADNMLKAGRSLNRRVTLDLSID